MAEYIMFLSELKDEALRNPSHWPLLPREWTAFAETLNLEPKTLPLTMQVKVSVTHTRGVMTAMHIERSREPGYLPPGYLAEGLTEEERQEVLKDLHDALERLDTLSEHLKAQIHASDAEAAQRMEALCTEVLGVRDCVMAAQEGAEL
jgi:hypothetical protein